MIKKTLCFIFISGTACAGTNSNVKIDKESDTTITITNQIVNTGVTLSDLGEQRAKLDSQRNEIQRRIDSAVNFKAAIDSKIADIDDQVAQAKALGVKSADMQAVAP